jgi:hypothetical protein
MSNAGKTVLNWKRDFPEIRVALGLLGVDGYTSMAAAHFLLWHEKLAKVREHYRKICGRELQGEVIHSRLRRPKELEALETGNPAAYAAGRSMKRLLLEDLKNARIARSIRPL